MNLDNPITSKQEKETGKLVKFTYTGGGLNSSLNYLNILN